MPDWKNTWEAMTPAEQAAVAESVQARSDELIASAAAKGQDTSWVKTGSALFDPETGMPRTYIPGEIAIGDTGTTVDAFGRLYPQVRELEARRTPEAFEAWKNRMGYTAKIEEHGENWSPSGSLGLWELFDSSLRTGRDNPMMGDRFGPGGGFVDGVPVADDGGGSPIGDDGSPVDDDGDDAASIRAEMQDAFYMALRLSGIPKADIDSLWAWAESELVNDPSFTAERALIGMYDSDAFKKRFPAIRKLNDLVEAGGTQRSVPTPGEYIAFEKDVMNELSRFGVEISEAVQDSGQGFDDLIESLYMNSVGFAEVTERLTTAEKAMHNMPPEVRDALIEWFGSDWASSISMKTFLDPKDDWSQVQDDIRTAETGGWGRMKAGLDAGWNRDLARQVSDLGLSQRDQWLKFVDLKEEELLYSEKLTEDEDLDYGTHGVRAAFDLKADDGFASGLELSDLITKREETRKAEFRGGGGAMITQSTTGFGAANV
tara:strand:- start:12 stop:1475 length:1464 start_codon:yes stop_codon:yes gene_type:complete